MDDNSTLEKIHEAAQAEFLEKGFLGAPLRNIVKTVEVTTGAFYGYYSSKEALIAALVEPYAAVVMGRFMTAQTGFAGCQRKIRPLIWGRSPEPAWTG
ncbi:TetR/AcrR family transcriptional regulator [Acutalibacter intestini]|uniref:TetR/AcrR family transcriptional regulator n=1 Tax=Acutalibacter intestini TaxID=3093659 RepID=UPI002AC9B5F8|nr:TetR/AcrR family transcriptional regulator [Acutalibacter sp. M00204]